VLWSDRKEIRRSKYRFINELPPVATLQISKEPILLAVLCFLEGSKSCTQVKVDARSRLSNRKDSRLPSGPDQKPQSTRRKLIFRVFPGKNSCQAPNSSNPMKTMDIFVAD
jgi:hypothetical protein